jgi:hypothetical protein
LEKETKNTIRYAEITEDGKPPAVRTIYVQRWALGNPPPHKIRVRVEEVPT